MTRTEIREVWDFEPRIHTAMAVYGEMLLQVCSTYHQLPDFESLTLSDIIFFYEGYRPSLKKSTKPRKPHGR